MIRVTVNSADRELPEASTIVAMLEQLQFDPHRVAVEVNRQVIPRIAHTEHRLTNGDQIEIVTLVGGG